LGWTAYDTRTVSRRAEPQVFIPSVPPGPGLPSNEESAAELASLAAAGDLQATQEFLAYVWPTLSRVAADVIALVRALPAFRGECHPAGYATRITLRVALRVRRNVKRDTSRREVLGVLSAAEELGFTSDDALAARRRELLRELLEDLPEEQAEALTLRVVLGFSLEEVSRASGAPINTVRSRVRLAKEALRQRIEALPVLAELKGAP
jgi:RNA polymerase sigma factor (sigma-70 family)